MTQHDDNSIFTTDTTLEVGDVAIIIRSDGRTQIAYNIPSLDRDGILRKNDDTMNLMLALATLEFSEDEAAYAAAIRRAIQRVETGSVKLH